MLQLKKFFWLILLALSLQGALAFSLLGPVGNGDDSYQATVIGYNPLPNGNGPPFFLDGLATGPKNLGEEYRRNVPVLYYAADSSFLDYFGSSGLTAVDNAYDILNLVSNVDSYSKGLTEFPLNTVEQNYDATALNLLDVKSIALRLTLEQLGLADSVRYTWALHDRYQPPGTTCPDSTEYTVIMRNYDITSSPLNQVQYSPYVNGVLYDYFVYENCGASGVSPPDADALEFPADPLENNPPVASAEDSISEGQFYNGLTRDDVAGLRYLLTSSNINTEAVESDSQLLTTNGSSLAILSTFSLAQLLSLAQTNPPDVLETLYPGLQITSVSTNFSYIFVTNFVTFLQPLIGAPGGAVQVVTQPSGFTPVLVTNYTYTFGNLLNASGQLINAYTTNKVTITLQTVQITNQIGAPYGGLNVSIVNKTIKTNGVVGDFFIVPPGLCNFSIVANIASQVIFTTNTILNATSITNDLGSSIFFQSVITSYTNHFLEVQESTCTTSAAGPALREGIESIKFIRANFDSLLGQFFQPITNIYSSVAISNSHAVLQTFQRIITQPDFLFTADDFTPGPSVGPAFFPVPTSRTLPIFDTSTIDPNANLAGPGVIDSPAKFTFNKVGPVFLNTGVNALTGGLGSEDFLWGSFDETTNAPIVYPNGTSIDDLISQVLIQVMPSTLPAATNNVSYDVTLSATGGQPPFTWSIVAGSLPQGLTLSSAGMISGTPTGNAAGVYYFTIELTDPVGRATDFSYSITVN